MTPELLNPSQSCAKAGRAVRQATSPQTVPKIARKFVSQGSVLAVVDQAVVSGASFGTTAIIARACATDQLGLYYLTMSLVLVLIGIQEQVVTAPFTIFRARHKGAGLAEYSGSVWLHQLAFVAVSWIVLLAALPALSAVGAANVVTGIQALLLFGPMLLLREAIRRFEFANLRFASAIVLDATVAIAQFTALLLLASLGMLSIGVIFAVLAAGCAVACCGWLVINRRNVRFVRARLWHDWIGNWSFAKWALPSYLVGNTTPLVMAWIVTLMSGTAATGVLGACVTLVNVVNVFILGMANALTPRTARAVVVGGPRELRRVLATTGLVLVCVLGASFLVSLLFGDRIAIFVYGDRFRDCGSVLATLALSVIATTVSMITGNGLWALGQPRANLGPDLCGMSVTVLGALALVPAHGALGAALATLAGAVSAAIVRTFILARAMQSFDPHAVRLGSSPAYAGAE